MVIMKKSAFLMLPALCMMAYALPANAQNAPQRPGPGAEAGASGEWANRDEKREDLTPAAAATIRTDEMKKLVNLDEKQYKKIYKLFLKDEEQISKEMYANQGLDFGDMMMGGPMGGGDFGGGGGPMGGGPMGGGMMMGGPMGGFGGGFGGSSATDPDEARKKTEKRQKKLEKNIKKVLTSEQYATWYQDQRMKARRRPGDNGERRPEGNPDRENGRQVQ